MLLSRCHSALHLLLLFKLSGSLVSWQLVQSHGTIAMQYIVYGKENQDMFLLLFSVGQ